MKKKIGFGFAAAIILASLLSTPGCNAWEGRYFLFNVSAFTAYYPATDESYFSISLEIYNEERVGVGARILNWAFEIYADDELLLSINAQNYDTFEYRVYTVVIPIPDTSVGAGSGFLGVISGREIDDWKVPGDLFGGKQPNKLIYSVLLEDENAYRNSYTGETTVNHTVVSN